MSEAFYIAASGAVVQNMQMEILANNMANINSAGYKQDRAVFRAYLPGTLDNSENANQKTPAQLESELSLHYMPSNSHAIFEGTKTDFSQGPKKFTGNSLDLAIDGTGFFSVETPDGIRYTRNGSFTLNHEGALVTKDGFPVQGDSGKISIENHEFTVDPKGNISVNGSQKGTLKIVSFNESVVLEKAGDSLFITPDGPDNEEAAVEMEIKQGYVELSNVNAVRSMTEMITALRSYESHLKALRSMDEVTSKAINDVGRTA